MLNENLNIQELKNEFKRCQRIRIQNIFKPECAEACYESLVVKTPWVLRYRHNGKAQEFTREQFEQLTPDQRMQMGKDLVNFDFIFHRFSMDQAFQQQADPNLYLYLVYEYLGSEHFLNFIREVTGFLEIKKRGAMAACYGPGHFLKEHDDYQNGEQRLCAYVLNISRDWKADWGGLLHFLGPDQNVIDTYVPMFNSLSLFAVPAPHFVSMVSPYAKHSRYSVTGWFYPN